MERVIIYNEKQSEDDDDAEVIVKIFVEFSQMSGKMIILLPSHILRSLCAICREIQKLLLVPVGITYTVHHLTLIITQIVNMVSTTRPSVVTDI